MGALPGGEGVSFIFSNAIRTSSKYCSSTVCLLVKRAPLMEAIKP